MNLPEIKIIDNSASCRRIEIKGGSLGHYPQRPMNFLSKNFHASLLDQRRPPVRPLLAAGKENSPVKAQERYRKARGVHNVLVTNR
jgi:hypothetical protein